MSDSVLTEVDNGVRALMDRHRVSLETGFLAEDPQEWLPLTWKSSDGDRRRNNYFVVIDSLLSHLPEVIKTGRVREEVDKLVVPPWDFEDLSWSAQNLLMLEIAMLAHAYFVETLAYKNVAELMADNRVHTLPVALAVPLWRLHKLTGIAPSCSYCLYSLRNYRKKNNYRPVALDNLELPHSFTGTLDERWFVWIHQTAEATFAPAIPPLLKARYLSFLPVGRVISEEMVCCLEPAADASEEALRILSRMREHCDYRTYFEKVRMYYSFPRRVVFDGVVELEGKPQEVFGETGGQTPFQHFRLAILGIKHENDLYFREMRKHMPHYFRSLIERVADSRVHDFVKEGYAQNQQLAVVYNRLVQSIVSWREFHIGLVEDYIKTFGEVHGTGKPPLIWLDKLKDETKTYLIPT